MEGEEEEQNLSLGSNFSTPGGSNDYSAVVKSITTHSNNNTFPSLPLPSIQQQQQEYSTFQLPSLSSSPPSSSSIFSLRDNSAVDIHGNSIETPPGSPTLVNDHNNNIAKTPKGNSTIY